LVGSLFKTKRLTQQDNGLISKIPRVGPQRTHLFHIGSWELQQEKGQGCTSIQGHMWIYASPEEQTTHF